MVTSESVGGRQCGVELVCALDRGEGGVSGKVVPLHRALCCPLVGLPLVRRADRLDYGETAEGSGSQRNGVRDFARQCSALWSVEVGIGGGGEGKGKGAEVWGKPVIR